MTAVSCSFYKNLVEARAPVGDLQPTARKLRGANGSQIDILGCSSCVVSFLGLQTEFPILVCDLSTDAIIGTDTLGSILPHTLRPSSELLEGLTVFFGEHRLGGRPDIGGPFRVESSGVGVEL